LKKRTNGDVAHRPSCNCPRMAGMRSDVVLKDEPWPRGASKPIFMALASKVQALALRAAPPMFDITFKCKKDTKINNSNNNERAIKNNKLIIIYM